MEEDCKSCEIWEVLRNPSFIKLVIHFTVYSWISSLNLILSSILPEVSQILGFKTKIYLYMSKNLGKV